MSVRVDLSPGSSLVFEREIKEAKQLLMERKTLSFLLDWGSEPFSHSTSLAADEFKKSLFIPFQSVVKSIRLFPLEQAFFLEPLKSAEVADFNESGCCRVDLFRRNLLSEFLSPIVKILGEQVPLELEVVAPPLLAPP